MCSECRSKSRTCAHHERGKRLSLRVIRGRRGSARKFSLESKPLLESYSPADCRTLRSQSPSNFREISLSADDTRHDRTQD